MSIFSGKRGRQGAMFAADQLQQGKTEANTALDNGFDQATEQYGKAGALFGDLAGSYQPASAMYGNALGLNGADGAATARTTFEASPGYDFNLSQGLTGLARARAVNGTLASGGADTDAMRFASGLASGEWKDWMDRLSGLDTKRFAATQGEAGTFGDLGKLAYGTGAAKAGLASQTAAGIAEAGMQGFKAGDDAESRKFGAIMGGANLVASLAGTAMGGGKGGYSIFGGK